MSNSYDHAITGPRRLRLEDFRAARGARQVIGYNKRGDAERIKEEQISVRKRATQLIDSEYHGNDEQCGANRNIKDRFIEMIAIEEGDGMVNAVKETDNWQNLLNIPNKALTGRHIKITFDTIDGVRGYFRSLNDDYFGRFLADEASPNYMETCRHYLERPSGLAATEKDMKSTTLKEQLRRELKIHPSYQRNAMGAVEFKSLLPSAINRLVLIKAWAIGQAIGDPAGKVVRFLVQLLSSPSQITAGRTDRCRPPAGHSERKGC